MFSSLFLQVMQMQLALQVFPFAKHSQYNFKQSILVHLHPVCRPWRGDKFKFSIVFKTYWSCCSLLKFKEGKAFKVKGPSSRRISKRSFLGDLSSMRLSRSLRLRIFREPEDDEECLDGNLKLECIFNYKLIHESNQKFKIHKYIPEVLIP